MVSKPNAAPYTQMSSPQQQPFSKAPSITQATLLLNNPYPGARNAPVQVAQNAPLPLARNAPVSVAQNAPVPMAHNQSAGLMLAQTTAPIAIQMPLNQRHHSYAGIGAGVGVAAASFPTPGLTTVFKQEPLGGVAAAPIQIPVTAQNGHVNLSGSPVNANGQAFIQQQQSPTNAAFTFPTANYMDLGNDGPLYPDAPQDSVLDAFEFSYNGISAGGIPPAENALNSLIQNEERRETYAEIIKGPYVMIRNRYNTEGKSKDEDGSSGEAEPDEDDEEEVVEDEEDVLESGGEGDEEQEGTQPDGAAAGPDVAAASAGGGAATKKKGTKKGKSKTASALIHHIPPEKKVNKNKKSFGGNKEEAGSGRATPVNGAPEKKKVVADPVVIRINNPPVGVVIWLRVSVVTNETPVPRPHAFQLTGSNCKNGIYYLKLFFQTPVADFDIEFKKVGLTYTKWQNMKAFLDQRISQNVNPFKATKQLTLEELKRTSKVNKAGADAMKAEPVAASTEYLQKRVGRKPGSTNRKGAGAASNQRQSAGAAAASLTQQPLQPPVNHLKQFRLAFEFLDAKKENQICPPVLSDAVFTDFEYIKIESVNPMIAEDSVATCLWVATSKLDTTNRPPTVRFTSPYFNGGVKNITISSCHKQVLLMVDAPKFDTPLNAGESAEVRMELVRFSGEREEISNSVLITYKHTIADGPPPNKVPNMNVRAMAGQAGDQAAFKYPGQPVSNPRIIRNPAPRASVGPLLAPPPQPQLQTYVPQPPLATQPIQILQVSNLPGIGAYIDQNGILQLVDNSQLTATAPVPSAIPATQWLDPGAAVTPVRIMQQAVASSPPAAHGPVHQPAPNPYSVGVTAAPSGIQLNASTLSLQPQPQQQDMSLEDLNDIINAAADRDIASRLAHICGQDNAAGANEQMVMLPPGSTGEQLELIAPQQLTSVQPLQIGNQQVLMQQLQPAMQHSPPY